MSDTPELLEGSLIEATYQLMLGLSRPLLLIPLDRVQAVVDEFTHMDSVMPILDPTGYRRILETKDGHERFARAFLRFRRELEELRGGIED